MYKRQEYKLLDNQIGYIFINEFDKTTLSEFTSALNDLMSKEVRGFILDVRFNYNGDFDSAVQVLDKIMPATTICSRREKTSSELKLFLSDANAVNLPFVVIQNDETAGAAEVFSAALKDNDLADIVGEISYGLGTGQRDIPLSNNTAIRLSVYEYITPNGEKINNSGISPDYTVGLDAEKKNRFYELTDDEDDQLMAAVSYMKQSLGLL